MGEVEETPLPGVGVRYEFVTSEGERLGIVHHRTGRRELHLYAPDDPDLSRETVELDEHDCRTLAELLGASQISEQLSHLQQEVEGLAIDWLPIRRDSPFAGRTIGDTAARTRTGTSIVAVLRGGEAIPAPGPDFGLEAGDQLVVVGTPRGVEQLAVILRSG